MKCSCGRNIEPERLEFKLTICKACAFNGRGPKKYKGVMNWSHKTAPVVQIMSSDCFDDQKRYYQPRGARSSVKNFSKNICA